ncbi:MAG: hypothetical protein HZR80_02220 [Candidatus Heimdallarchaeota archaeon]
MNIAKIELSQNKIENRKKLFDEVLNSVDPKFYKTCKAFFDNFFHSANTSEDLKLKVIVDANIVISESLVYIKKKKSYLLQLLNSPFINIVAPDYLRRELNEKVDDLSRSKKIKKSDLRRTFDMFLSKIKLVNRIDDIAYFKAKELIGSKDEKDVPYLGMFFSIDAFAILTNDTDFKDLPEVQIWNRPGDAGRFVSVMQKGTISFYVVSTSPIFLLNTIGEILLLLLSSLWGYTEFIVKAITSISTKGIKKFLEMSFLLQLLIGIGLFAFIIWEKDNKIIRNSLKKVANKMIGLLREFHIKLWEIAKIITPYIAEELVIWICLFSDHILNTIELYEKINPLQEKMLKYESFLD